MAIKINGDNSTSAVGLSGGDDDSGVKPGTNAVEIVTGGTARVTVNNTGTTMSGTANVVGNIDTGSALYVNTDGTRSNSQATIISYADDGTTATGALYGDGKLLLGNNTSDPKISLLADGKAEFENRLKIQRTDSDTSAALLIVNAAGNTNQHIFYGNGTISLDGGKIAIDGPSGNINMQSSGGNILFDNGKGISFQDTPDGVTMSSELFDDYEEGTWTPVINDSTPSTQAGRYTKIGRKVFITWRYGTSNRTSAAVDLRLTGFPFSPTDINSFGGGLTVRNAVDGSDQLTLSYDGSITGIKFKKQTNNANASNLQLDDVAAGYSLFGWAMYDA